jgi:large subunit ribosomal protein L13
VWAVSGALVIDGEGHVAGRLASVVAKKLLMGESVVVVNAEKIVITGKPRAVFEKFYKRWAEWRTYYNPEKRGPKYPRMPDRLFKRMVRGMLPDKPKGREALKRLRVFIGVPREFADKPKVKIQEALFTNPYVSYVTLGELCRMLSQRVFGGEAG